MKKLTHGWLALQATKRLSTVTIDDDRLRATAVDLVEWLKGHRDSVLQGAWYPDEVIRDMAKSHVLKMGPGDQGRTDRRKLPSTYAVLAHAGDSPMASRPYRIDENDNLPDRCEALAHSVIDHMKIVWSEDRGSPVAPSNNQVALILFMLSHYIADAHVPFHCDARSFSSGDDVHGELEKHWDDAVRDCYRIDHDGERFLLDSEGFPLTDRAALARPENAFLGKVETALARRDFTITWGSGNRNTWDFMVAICQHSYLLSYAFIPETHDHTNVTRDNWDTLSPLGLGKDDLAVVVLSDAIDSIARVWLRVWRKYRKWRKIY